LENDAKLASSSEELSRWIDVRNQTRIDNWRQIEASLPSPRAIDVKVESPHFITEMYFATYRILHLGYLRNVTRLQVITRELNEHKSSLKQLEDSRQAWVGTAGAAHNEAIVGKLKEAVQNLTAERCAIIAQLLEPGLLQNCYDFCNLTMIWLMQLLQLDGSSLQLPSLNDLNVESVLMFANLPEHCLENVAEFFLFLSGLDPSLSPLFASIDFDRLLLFLVLFLQNPSYVRNPHLRQKLVEVFRFVWFSALRNLRR
jgi:hypothetical protein